MLLTTESVLSLNENKHSIGLHTFKLPTSTKIFYD